MWFQYWWQVSRLPFPAVLCALPLPIVANRTTDDLFSHLTRLVGLGLIAYAAKQFLESRNIKVNSVADQAAVRQSAIVSLTVQSRVSEGRR